MMTFHPYGDSAILINFEQRIDADINAQVSALTRSIEAANIDGITFCIPAYCSLTVGYDPSILHYEQWSQILQSLINSVQTKVEQKEVRKLQIPVCYDLAFAIDMEEVQRQKDLSVEEIINLHESTTYRVYMLGFLPGFAYMGRLPEALYVKRKTTPRLRVPAQSVGLAGFQTGIYPSIAPGGWQIIGKTPLKTFDGRKENPFLFQAGDNQDVQVFNVPTSYLTNFPYGIEIRYDSSLNGKTILINVAADSDLAKYAWRL